MGTNWKERRHNGSGPIYQPHRLKKMERVLQSPEKPEKGGARERKTKTRNF